MYRLKSLTIYEHPRVECSPKNRVVLNFHAGANLILGVNGSGKTTLLKLIEAVCAGNWEEMSKHGLPVELEGEFVPIGTEHSISIRQRLRFRNSGVTFEPPEMWAGFMSATQPYLQQAITIVRGSEPPECFQPGPNFEWERVDNPMMENRTGNYLLTSPITRWPILTSNVVEKLRNVSEEVRAALANLSSPAFPAPERLDEHLDYFSSIFQTGSHVTREILSIRMSPSEASSHYLAAPQNGLWAIFRGDFPPDLHGQARDRMVRNGISAFDRFEIENCVAFERFTALVHAKSLRMRFTNAKSDDANSRSYTGSDVSITWPNGVTHPASDLSFGQKRLLAFLWMVHTHTHGPVLCDELANGLHWEWVQECIKEIGDRQSFHAVQNPLMIDELLESEADVVQRQLIMCSRGQNGKFVWEQLSDKDAESLSVSAKRSVRSMSSILRNKNLW